MPEREDKNRLINQQNSRYIGGAAFVNYFRNLARTQLKYTGVLRSNVGEMEAKSLDALGDDLILIAADDGTQKKLPGDVLQFRTEMEAAGVKSVDLLAAGQVLKSTASTMRTILQNDSLVQRMSRAIDLAVEGVKEQATMLATGERDMYKLGGPLPVSSMSDAQPPSMLPNKSITPTGVSKGRKP